jgi:hypothetical protein
MSPRPSPVATGRPTAVGRGRRHACAALLAAVCLLALAAPMTALATTGTHTDKKTVVTITNKGATYVPTLAQLKVTTGVTVKVLVVNKASQPHTFQLGTRKTKTLKTGASDTFFYLFHIPTKVSWEVGLGNVRAAAFRGSINVSFPKHFN